MSSKIDFHFNTEQLPILVGALEDARDALEAAYTALDNSHPDDGAEEARRDHNRVRDDVEKTIHAVDAAIAQVKREPDPPTDLQKKIQGML